MVPSDWFENLKSLLEGMKTVRDLGDNLTKVWPAVSSMFRRSASSNEADEYLMIGPGGVGKTTLAKLLAKTPPDDARYAESIEWESFSLVDPPATCIVAPGQKRRRQSQWTELGAELQNGRFSGVILVVCYGYHSLSNVDFGQFGAPERPTADRLQEHLEKCRRDEDDVRKQVVDWLTRAPRRVWYLTLVTKQDLWWQNRAEVQAHYGRRVPKFMPSDAETSPIRHELAFTSLAPLNFRDRTGRILAETAAGYDWEEVLRSWNETLRIIASLKAWGEEQ